MVDNRRVASYVWEDASVPRPYFSSLVAPGGTQVTRNYPPDPKHDAGNDDHATFHPGAWLAFGDINGEDFWRNRARVRHARFLSEPKSGDDTGSFAVLSIYETHDDSPTQIAESHDRFTFRVTEYGYLLECEFEFLAGEEAVVFGDQEEMGFGVRLATPLTVEHGGGTLLNSAGGRDESGTWGKAASWCAGGKTVDGTTIGAVILPHPDNFRPSWFHSRDYGLIVANPFGEKAMTGPRDPDVAPASTSIDAGDSMTLGFALGLFQGPGDMEQYASALHQAYVSGGAR